MSKAISIRIQPRTGRQAGGQRRHDLRDQAHMPDYVDQTRTGQNSVIIKPPDPETVRAEIAWHRLAAGQQKLRADARTTIAGIITFGKEAQPIVEGLPSEGQDALFQRVAERVAKETDRLLLGLVVHRDESAVHAHFTLRGYKLENGKEVAPRLSRTDLQRIQDAAAQEVAHLGIERGVSRAIREARGDDMAKVVHRSVRELHKALPREIEAAQARKLAIEQEVAALEAKRANNERLAEKARQNLEDGKGREMALQKRLAVYEERARKAGELAKVLESEVAALEARNRAAGRAIGDIWRLTDALADAFKHVDPDLSKDLQAQAKIPTAPDLHGAVRMACELRNTLNTPQAEQVIKRALAHARDVEEQQTPPASQPRRAQEKGKRVEI